MFSIGSYWLLIVSLILLPVIALAENLPFSKLFTTPQEREYLNKIRTGEQSTTEKIIVNTNDEKKDKVLDKSPRLPVGSTIEEAQKTAQKNKAISLSGYILRADGGQQIWINGQKIKPNQSINAVVNASSKTDVIIKTGDKKIPLNVGQRWQQENNTVIDVYKKP